jgi:transposase
MIQDAGWIGGQHLMPKAYSLDLRKRAVSRVLDGESVRSVAMVLDVSVSAS